jgi:exonuclease 3'-5' domain-containing protein 2
VGNAAKSKLIYGNCKLLAPNGTLLCRCNREKADWYTSRNLAEVEQEEPHTVRLNFEPKGMGHSNEPYYLAEKENRCVVCGAENDLTSHHCVPLCFRRWLPQELKKFSSHDVLVVCVSCHKKYEARAWELKSRLFFEANGKKLGEWNREKRREFAAISAAHTLIHFGAKVPPDGVKRLLDRVVEYLGREPLDLDLLNLSAKRRQRSRENRKSCNLGVVMGKSVIDKTTNLYQFMKIWRQHFVMTMNPQYLPKYWDINHLLEEKDGVQQGFVGVDGDICSRAGIPNVVGT